ncbi:MAG: 30S ribosomal protein S6 [Flavobacteriales bacterium]|jgi:small subunit ribosomal protein S6|nr:30S ribosomal protein S6 [Flavobacteriales bacterium]
MNNYETVFILNPVLSEEQAKETVSKFTGLLESNGAEIVNLESWGLRKLAYPIQKKSTGFYHLVEFKVDPAFISKFEVEFKRDERIMRFLTVKQDKYAQAYSQQRRDKLSNAKKS